MFDRPPLQPTDAPAPTVTTPATDTMESAVPLKGHALCRLCRDGTYATQTMQSFVGDNNPWEPYCDPCGAAFASVIKDSSQNRDAEIRRLPTPPMGKAPPKVPKVGPTPKSTKGSKVPPKVLEAPAAVVAPTPPVEVRPRMSLAEAMRPTAPKPVPVSTKSAKNALRDAVRDVEGYDLLTMLGMKR